MLADDILYAPIHTDLSDIDTAEIDFDGLVRRWQALPHYRPCYQVLAQCFFPVDVSEGMRLAKHSYPQGTMRLVNPGEIIEFNGSPNEAMKPLNMAAMTAVIRNAALRQAA